jgi:hypothetical protein
MDWDQLLMFDPNLAPVPTWTVELDGAELVYDDPVQTWWLAMWEVDVPSPGGSVTATVSAGPPDKFKVVDADCMLDGSPFVSVPSTLNGQSLAVQFDAAPDGRFAFTCFFTFDPTSLPRPTPYATTPPLPQTDAAGRAGGADGTEVSGLAILMMVGLGAALLVLTPRRHVR